MTAAGPGTGQAGVPWQKRVADLCTAARAPLAVGLVWLGGERGKDGVQLAFLLLLAAATLDTLDGYFARLSQSPYQTWIGAHDLAFDIGFSAALLLYLAMAEYVSPYLAAFWAGFWILVAWYQGGLSNTGAVLFQAPIYLAVVVGAVLSDVDVVLWIVVWVTVMLAFAGRRFFRVRVPTFLGDLAGRVSGQKHWTDHGTQRRREAKE